MKKERWFLLIVLCSLVVAPPTMASAESAGPTNTPTNTPTYAALSLPSVGCIGGAAKERLALKKQLSAAQLDQVFAAASKEFAVPVEILKAVAKVESNMLQDGPTIDYGYGVMHLVDNSYCQTLKTAAALTGISVKAIKADPVANIRAGAALIAKYAKETVGTPKSLKDYFAALKKFSGLINDQIQEIQAQAYFQAMGVDVSDLTNLGAEIKSTDYGPALWVASPNYNSRSGTAIDRWVNHWIGSGTYAGAISWFQNPASQVSAHFVCRSSDGQLTQMVRIADRAWHCGDWNSRSIGIEHEATTANPGLWDSGSMVGASAEACKYFCNAYGIPKTRSYIIGHKEVPNASTDCPGPLPWNDYMAAVGSGLAVDCYGTTVVGINQDGRQEVFTMDANGNPYHRWQYSGGWTGWTMMGGVVLKRNSMVVIKNSSNCLELFGVGTDNAMYHTWQTSPNGGWSGWAGLGGSWQSDICVGKNQSGYLEIFAIGVSDTKLYHSWWTGSGWASWALMLSGTGVTSIDIGMNSDGRLEVFTVKSSGIAYHAWQTAPNGSWSSWASFGGTFRSNIEVGKNQDGRLEIFATKSDNTVWNMYQLSPGGSWSGWSSMGGSSQARGLAVGSNQDGRQSLFACTSSGTVSQKYQTVINGGWSGWAGMGSTTLYPEIGVGKNTDGRLEIYAPDVSGRDMLHNYQTAPNGGFSGWSGF